MRPPVNLPRHKQKSRPNWTGFFMDARTAYCLTASTWMTSFTSLGKPQFRPKSMP
jgi:hypothetical protein